MRDYVNIIGIFGWFEGDHMDRNPFPVVEEKTYEDRFKTNNFQFYEFFI